MWNLAFMTCECTKEGEKEREERKKKSLQTGKRHELRGRNGLMKVKVRNVEQAWIVFGRGTFSHFLKCLVPVGY